MAPETPPSLRREVVWLDDREHRWLNRLAAAAVPVLVLVHQPWLVDARRSRLVLVGFGIGFAFALWIVGRMRHRLWAAFASFLMLFAPWGFAFVAGAPYVVFAFWLLRCAYRDVKGRPPGRT